MAARASKKTTVIAVSKPLKEKPERLPWPRFAADNPTVQLGVDVVAKQRDIIRLVHKFFHVDSIAMEELLQEVYLTIIHKNHTRSAHDPRKSSFGHYVYMIANNVCINLVHKKKRYDRERDSIYEPMSDEDLAPIETAQAEGPDESYDSPTAEAFEVYLRRNHMYDLARYVRATRLGANPIVLREALSFGQRKVDAKTIRGYRENVESLMDEVTASTFL